MLTISSLLPLYDFTWDLLREDVFLLLGHEEHFFFSSIFSKEAHGEIDRMSEIIKKFTFYCQHLVEDKDSLATISYIKAQLYINLL